ncbi:hypothetical protein [Synechococcus sp. O70.1]|uniref:hypothetical protein n=1 Tax=Synechococcus sp. O70.1 TaxID=2964535 RepID=UPI0039C4216C
MLIPTLLFASPSIVSGLLDGSLVRYGGVVREAATGCIVKHLAEAPGLTSLLMNAPGLEAINWVINSLAHQATHRKLEILQHTATKILGLSQVSAGASVLNLGVSAIGFTYMHFRLNQLQISLLASFGRSKQSRNPMAISNLHRDLFIQSLAKLQAELASLHRFHEASPRNALKALAEARIFFL